MWNRNSKQSGPNEAPLGNTRRWGGAAGGAGDSNNDSNSNGQAAQSSGGYGDNNNNRNNSRDGGGSGGGYGNQQGGGGGGGGGVYGNSNSGYGNDSRGGGGGDRGRGGYESRNDSRGGNEYNSQQGGNRHDNNNSDRNGPPRPQHGGYQSQQQHQPQSSAWDSPQSNNSNNAPPASALDALGGAPTGERKRKSRWGNEKADVGGMPTAITGGVDGKDLESYAVQLRLDEIARSLRSGLVVPPDGSRSPSPPPTYDSHGRRTNTREVRYRKRLEDERMRLVDRQVKSDPNFKPPTEYLLAKRANGGRPTDKVYIPVKEFPEINFFGLLVGPRGNSLKNMERDSGAKISIRGKGSVKEGKGRPGGGFEDDENEELHCLVTGETEEKVQRCVKLINSVIETAASVPEGQNDHKRGQLRELAQLNGTLRDDENQVCQNCGGLGHRKYECPEQKNWTAGIICRTCGGAGHMARDCTQGKSNGFSNPGGAPGGGGVDQVKAQQFDSEYASLMAELGETSSSAPVAGSTPVGNAGGGEGGQQAAAPWNNGGGNNGDHPLDDKGDKIPPWRMPQYWNQPQGGGHDRGRPQQQIYQQQHQQHNNQQQQAQHTAYTGNSVGYSSFPQANMAGASYGGYPQQQQQQYPQQGYQQQQYQ